MISAEEAREKIIETKRLRWERIEEGSREQFEDIDEEIRSATERQRTQVLMTLRVDDAIARNIVDVLREKYGYRVYPQYYYRGYPEVEIQWGE